MASNKTPNLGMDIWAETDYFKRAELNGNFSKLDNSIKEKDDRITSLTNDFTSSVDNSEYVLSGIGIDPTGVSDCTPAVQSLFDLVASKGGGTINVPKGNYKFDSTLKYYPDKISLVSTRDVTFNLTQTSGYAIEIQAYETLNVKDYLEQAYTRFVAGIKFKASNPSIFILRSKGNLLGKFASGWLFYRCSFIGASTIEINNDTWAVNFERCYIKPTIDAAYGIYMPSGGTNYGEKISINNSVFDESKLAIYNANGEGDIRVTQTSIDYCRQAVVVNGGIVSLDNVFVESSSNVSHWFEVDGYGAQLNIGTIQIVDMVTTRTVEIFRVADDTNDSLLGSGLTITDIKLTTGKSSLPFLIKGNGRALVGRIDTYRDAKKSVIARFMNQLAFGNCDTTNSADEWDTHRYTTIKPILDTTEKYEGVGSLKFSVGTAGYSVGAQASFPCRPGQTPRVKYHAKTANLQANSKSLVCEWRFLNRKGTQIKTGTGKTISTNVTSWTEYFFVPDTQAPPGTTSVEVSFYGNAWTLDCTAWIDDVVINVI